jgi:hypothetical protein
MTTNILASRAMLARLTICQWSARKLDKSVTDKVNKDHGAAADAGRFNKLLISADALAEIARIAGEARAMHYHFTLPWQDDGARILPAAAFQNYSDRMRTFRRDFEAAVSRFLSAYPDYVADARARLNGMFNPADYPDAADVKSRFAFRTPIDPIPDAADFRVTVGDAQADAIRAEITERIQDATRASVRACYERIGESVGRMAERLKAYKPADGRGGKAEGIFRDSLVDNVRELAAILPALNITADPDLSAIAERINSALISHDADMLRESDSIRSRVAAEASAIADHVAGFLA